MADIAINPVTRRVQFTGNTGTGPFAFTFNVLQASDIVVYKNNNLLTLTTDYTVTINANGTGSITLVSALVTADVLVIVGGRELSRTTDFVTSGDLLAASLNEQLDSNVIMSQQLDERISRAIRIQPGDETADLYLPLKTSRQDKILSFDSSGNVTAKTATEIAGGTVLGANYTLTTATGDGSKVAFVVAVEPGSENNIQIYIDGVYQNKASFSLSGTTVTFSEAPPLNSSIEFIIGSAITSVTAGDASSLTYTQGGSGSVQRTGQSKFQEFVSVKDFGAVGDGVTDDTLKIQAALDAVKAAGGGTVYFPKGVYIISNANSSRGVVVGSNTTVIGAGRGASILRRKLASQTKIMSVADDTSGNPATRTYDVTISGITFDGQADLEPTTGGGGAHQTWEYGHNLDIRASQRVTVENCEIKNSIGDGIYIQSRCVDITIRNNWISSTEAYDNNRNTRMGIAVISCWNLLIEGNTIRDFLWHIDGEIDNNEVTNPSVSGGVIGYRNVIVRNNILERLATTTKAEGGIYFYPHPSSFTSALGVWDGITISGNIIKAVQRDAIHVESYSASANAEKVLISDNLIYECEKGIVLSRCEDFSITGNRIFNATETGSGYGIQISNLDTNFVNGSVTGNSVYRATNSCISLGGGIDIQDGVVISGNSLWNNTGSGVNFLNFFGTASVTGNDINCTSTYSAIIIDADTVGATDTPFSIQGNHIRVSTGTCVSFDDNAFASILSNAFIIGADGTSGGKYFNVAASSNANIFTAGNYFADNSVDLDGKDEDVISKINSYNWNRLSLTEEYIKPSSYTVGGSNDAPSSTRVLEIASGSSNIQTIRSAHNSISLIFRGSVTVEHQGDTGANSINLSGAANFSATADDTLTLVKGADGEWYETGRVVI